MSGPWDAKFTDDQKEAAALARVDGHRTARRVAEMAAAGELTHRGEPVGAFDISANYVNQLGQRLTRARRGEAVSKVAELPHRDALEVLRRRLVSAADALLTAYEKQLAKDAAKADPERLRQIMRCQLEASRLPGPSDARTAPGTRRDETGQKGSRTAGGIGGAMLREHRRQAETAQDDTHNTGEGGDSSAPHDDARSNGAEQGGQPGALTSERDQAAAPLVVGV